MSLPRSRSYCLTLNNYSDEEYQNLISTPCNYLVLGKERGIEGTPHLQGYICFTSPRSFNAVKAIHRRAHWEIAKGDAESNREYCSKENDYIEVGLPPISKKRIGESEAERWRDAKRCAIEGNLEDVPDDIFVRYYRTLKEIKKDYMTKPSDLDALENYWIWGKPGCGKSRSARERFPEFYSKMMNKWWDGYQGEENILIDDFELDGKVLGHHLKIWADRYAFVAETKGGAINIRPKRIIITSNYSPDMVFGEDREMLAAVLRRFNVECMSVYDAMTFQSV